MLAYGVGKVFKVNFLACMNVWTGMIYRHISRNPARDDVLALLVTNLCVFTVVYIDC